MVILEARDRVRVPFVRRAGDWARHRAVMEPAVDGELRRGDVALDVDARVRPARVLVLAVVMGARAAEDVVVALDLALQLDEISEFAAESPVEALDRSLDERLDLGRKMRSEEHTSELQSRGH